MGLVDCLPRCLIWACDWTSNHATTTVKLCERAKAGHAKDKECHHWNCSCYTCEPRAARAHAPLFGAVFLFAPVSENGGGGGGGAGGKPMLLPLADDDATGAAGLSCVFSRDERMCAMLRFLHSEPPAVRPPPASTAGATVPPPLKIGFSLHLALLPFIQLEVLYRCRASYSCSLRIEQCGAIVQPFSCLYLSLS